MRQMLKNCGNVVFPSIGGRCVCNSLKNWEWPRLRLGARPARRDLNEVERRGAVHVRAAWRIWMRTAIKKKRLVRGKYQRLRRLPDQLRQLDVHSSIIFAISIFTYNLKGSRATHGILQAIENFQESIRYHDCCAILLTASLRSKHHSSSQYGQDRIYFGVGRTSRSTRHSHSRRRRSKERKSARIPPSC